MPYFLLLFASIFWGGNYVVGHIVVNTINPYFLSFIRWGLTSLLMFSLYYKVIKREWRYLVENMAMNTLYSLLGQVLFPLTLYIGLQYTSSLNTSIYISSTPCLVLLINKIFFKEKISARNIMGVIVSTIGVVHLALSNSTESGSGGFSHFGLGDIMTIISALSWAGYCSLLRLKDKRVTQTAFVGFCSLIGTVILIPIYILYLVFSTGSAIFVNTPNIYSILGIIYLVIFPSWLAYVFWGKGVQLIGTTRSEIFTHGIPISGGLLGIIFLGDTLETYHIISLICIVFGIICCSTSKGKKVQQSHSTS